MSDGTDGPVTLGDKIKLQRLKSQKSRRLTLQRSQRSIAFLDRKSMEVRDKKLFSFPRISFIPPTIGLLSWWASASPVIGIGAMSLAILYFTLVYFDKAKQNKTTSKKTKKRKRVKQGWDNNALFSGEKNFLISNDKQGFMESLKLSDKTVIFDGSNIYHFGVDHGVNKKALKTLVRELRAEGFRIICFFDANIYYPLRDNNEFQNNNEKFSIAILQTVFDLKKSEIYIVPSGKQADKYIIESLFLLPISFAVTNDKYRDYEDEYGFLAKDKLWRKGVTIKGGNLLLHQHKFKQPLVM